MAGPIPRSAPQQLKQILFALTLNPARWVQRLKPAEAEHEQVAMAINISKPACDKDEGQTIDGSKPTQLRRIRCTESAVLH